MSSPTYNDNSVPFGSRTEVLSSGTYIFEDISLNHPTKTIERPNAIGEPNGFVLVSQLPTGSATVQIPLTSSNIPHVGDTFTDTFLGNASETWVVDSVSPPISIGNYRKVNIGLKMAHLAAGGYIPSGTPSWSN